MIEILIVISGAPPLYKPLGVLSGDAVPQLVMFGFPTSISPSAMLVIELPHSGARAYLSLIHSNANNCVHNLLLVIIFIIKINDLDRVCINSKCHTPIFRDKLTPSLFTVTSQTMGLPTEVARQLELGRSTVYREMQRLGVLRSH